MRKYIILLCSVLPNLYGFEYKGNIGIESSYIEHDIENKRDNQNALRLDAEIQQSFAQGKMVINLKVVRDLNDKERRYFDFNDFYYKHNFENGDLLIGRNTRFWGAMEFYNHTDVFNTKDWLDNPFDYDSKIGSKNIAYTHYFDNSELSVIAKLHEETQSVQENKSVNRFLPAIYNDKLITQKDRNRPTIYLKYSASAEERQLDYSFIYQNGYDEQRYLTQVGTELRQHAYIVNKLMGYATLVSGETIYKTEVAYTKSDDDLVSDYGQVSLGLEHTLYGIWDKRDLGLLAEYYRYVSADNKKLGAKEFGNLFDDDITLGFRLSMNDSSSSEILGGLAIDRDNKEKILFVEYDTRLFEKYKLGLTYQHLAPKEDSSFEELDRVMVEFGYYF
ncbi:hypothetical protein MNB_SV-12-1090 [hydrothermal vent metagenome]|uniref:Uncharacterized protein n=1 Tax=hydrothermal vent metagenome TaxID=652676 RepID=A0A1W1BBQ8_9ZZZZ